MGAGRTQHGANGRCISPEGVRVARGGDTQDALPATTSTHVSNPRSLSYRLSYDVASRLCPALGRGDIRHGVAVQQGKAVQVDPMKPMLKAPGTTRLTL